MQGLSMLPRHLAGLGTTCHKDKLYQDVALTVVASAQQAVRVHGYWLPRHIWHMPLKGHALIPDVACFIVDHVPLV